MAEGALAFYLRDLYALGVEPHQRAMKPQGISKGLVILTIISPRALGPASIPSTNRGEGPLSSIGDCDTTSEPSTVIPMRDEPPNFQRKPLADFSFLIEQLQIMRENGVSRPYRSTVHAHITDLKPSIYNEARVESFTQYFNLAKDAGIVELGGVGVRQYISLVS